MDPIPFNLDQLTLKTPSLFSTVVFFRSGNVNPSVSFFMLRVAYILSSLLRFVMLDS